nr:hypothetical protein [Mycoplasmopsis bovis]
MTKEIRRVSKRKWQAKKKTSTRYNLTNKAIAKSGANFRIKYIAKSGLIRTRLIAKSENSIRVLKL